ncbi:hypothetical protein ACRQ84_23180 (plasmid) [Enterobacter ludwigii]
MYDMVHGRYDVEWLASPAAGGTVAVQGVGVSECTQMEITVICDVISVGLQYAGVQGKVLEEAAA